MSLTGERKQEFRITQTVDIVQNSQIATLQTTLNGITNKELINAINANNDVTDLKTAIGSLTNTEFNNAVNATNGISNTYLNDVITAVGSLTNIELKKCGE